MHHQKFYCIQSVGIIFKRANDFQKMPSKAKNDNCAWTCTSSEWRVQSAQYWVYKYLNMMTLYIKYVTKSFPPNGTVHTDGISQKRSAIEKSYPQILGDSEWICYVRTERMTACVPPTHLSVGEARPHPPTWTRPHWLGFLLWYRGLYMISRVDGVNLRKAVPFRCQTSERGVPWFWYKPTPALARRSDRLRAESDKRQCRKFRHLFKRKRSLQKGNGFIAMSVFVKDKNRPKFRHDLL